MNSPGSNPPGRENPFPPEPPVKETDGQAEVKKIRYQAWLDLESATPLASVELRKAKLLAEIEVRKNKKLAEIEIEKTDELNKLEGLKTRREQDFSRETADVANDFSITQKYHEGYIEVAKGQIERASTRAEFVQKAAAAIGGAYTTILALSFAITTDAAGNSMPLPARGLAPTIFAGLAIILSTAYTSFITKPEDIKTNPGDINESNLGSGTAGKQSRMKNEFILWTRGASGLKRRRLLQASIMCLGLSVFFLPAAYLNVADWHVLVAGLLALILLLLAILVFEKIDPD